MNYQIIQIPVGSFQTNCYIIYNEKKNCVIIDPGAQSQAIIRTIEERGLHPLYILLTHAHADHIGAVADVKEEFNLPVYLHRRDRRMLEDEKESRAAMLGLPFRASTVDVEVTEETPIPFDKDVFRVIETPGHTGGGVCYQIDNLLFSGDTLFNGSIGRTDFPESNHNEMMKSLKKLIQLPKDIVVFPGHGAKTTLEYELKYNPFLQYYD